MAIESTTQPRMLSPGQPAAAAVARVARAGALLAALGITSSLFAISRVIVAWRVTPATTSHEISIVGQTLT
jgi:hypothetical protein